MKEERLEVPAGGIDFPQSRLERAYRVSDFVSLTMQPGNVGTEGSTTRPDVLYSAILPLVPEMVRRRLYYFGENADIGAELTAACGTIQLLRNGAIVFELPFGSLRATDTIVGAKTYPEGIIALCGQTINNGTTHHSIGSDVLCFYRAPSTGTGRAVAGYPFHCKAIADSARLRIDACLQFSTLGFAVYSETETKG